VNSAEPSTLLLAYYGDDFTGSTDVLEACERSGLRTVLFLEPPSPDQLAQFPEAQVAGVAGISRAQTPAWMRRHLPAIFEKLKALRAPVCHYKVCSTFDSSPQVGSIGCALEIGQQVFQSSWVPIVVGAPILRRYVVFGNLFAGFEGATYRIDRHPTMSRHPITPMHEADLRLHLRAQTQIPVNLIDILALWGGQAEPPSGPVLFDTLDEASLAEAGRLIWSRRCTEGSLFAVGSSGLEYALTAWWRKSGEVKLFEPNFSAPPADRILVVSGSCSPVTEQQIRWAMENGFDCFAADPDAEDSLRIRALASLAAGRSVVIYSALGPSGPHMLVGDRVALGQRLGVHLGRLLKRLLLESGVRRALVAGGDTSGYVAHQLGIQALTILRPMAPGSPLCRAWSSDPQLDGLEILLKGGQVGGPELFGQVRAGTMELPRAAAL
jgi:uncharacterized protein YgbK (DUF1537 family)